MKPFITLMLTLGSSFVLKLGGTGPEARGTAQQAPWNTAWVSAALEVGVKLGLAALLNLRRRSWN